MKEIVFFEHALFGRIRTSMTEQGDPLLCLADLCKAIGVKNHRNVVKRLDEGDVRRMDTPTKNQFGATVMQQIVFVTEPGMYDDKTLQNRIDYFHTEAQCTDYFIKRAYARCQSTIFNFGYIRFCRVDA